MFFFIKSANILKIRMINIGVISENTLLKFFAEKYSWPKIKIVFQLWVPPIIASGQTARGWTLYCCVMGRFLANNVCFWKFVFFIVQYE